MRQIKIFSRLAIFLLVVGLAAPAFAEDALGVMKPWARASIGTAGASAAYFTIRNTGRHDVLTGAETPVAGMAQLHTHVHEDGVARMKHIEAVPVPTGETVTFEPGGYHVMLMRLKKPLKAGTQFPLTLHFKNAGKRTLNVTVMGPGSMGPEQAHQ